MKRLSYYLAIGTGSFLGGGCRYFFEWQFNKPQANNLPLGTLLVNGLGSIIIGMIMALFLKKSELPPLVKTFLTTGFCGGFTTFSSFSFETIQLMSHHLLLSGVYVVLTMVMGILGVLLGMTLVLGNLRNYDKRKGR